MLVALIMLLIITLIGIASTRTQTLEVRMASNVQNRNIALQAAEATLRFVEGNLQSGLYTNFAQNANGLYTFDPTMTSAWYSTTNITWGSSSTTVITYSGPSLPSDLYAAAPQFIIEALPTVVTSYCGNASYGNYKPTEHIYRITAHATGGDASSTVTLQSLFEVCQ